MRQKVLAVRSLRDALHHRIENFLAAQHLGQLGELREGADQILDPSGALPFAPQVVGAAGHHRLRADGGLLYARPFVRLDGGEQGCVDDHHLEGVDLVALVDRDHHGIGLLDGPGDVLSGRLRCVDEHLLADGVDGLVPELVADLLPAEILPRPPARRLQTVARRNGEDEGVAIDPGTVRRGGLVDETPGFGAGFAGLRGGLGSEYGVVELAVVGDVAGSFGQVVDLGAGGGRA